MPIFFSSPLFLEYAFFPMSEFVCSFLKPDNWFKLYFADLREAIRVSKDGLGDDKIGKSSRCLRKNKRKTTKRNILKWTKFLESRSKWVCLVTNQLKMVTFLWASCDELNDYSTKQYFWSGAVVAKERNTYCTENQVCTVREWISICHLQFIPGNRELFALEMESLTSEMARMRLEEKVVALLHIFWSKVYHVRRLNEWVP